MIEIITSFYISNLQHPLDNVRTNEIITTLKNNLKNEFVEKIHLFVDNELSLNLLFELKNHIDNTNKIVVNYFKKQPKYSDYFRYILENVKNKICMITNSDIFLLECDKQLIDRLKTEKIMYCLTRHEENLNCPLIDRYEGSHDCYIFNSSFIETSIINEHTDFYQNMNGIEHHIITTFFNSGFLLFNPCKQIKIVHLHSSELRGNYVWVGFHPLNSSSNEFIKINKPYYHVPPEYI